MTFPSFSIIIPVYCERDNIYPLIERISSTLPYGYEVIFVDDGSNDGTKDALEETVKKYEFVRAIYLGQRIRKGAALKVGYSASLGDTIVTLDGDLQNDPADIPNLLSALQEAHFVVGWRKNRRDSLQRRIQSFLYNTALRILAASPLHDINSGFRAFRKEILKNPLLLDARYRIFPLLAHFSGFTTKEVIVDHFPRRYGKSKYGFGRIFSAIADIVIATFARLFLKKKYRTLTQERK
jgi:glycosyltransferase involved in cell wall biosynthesis